VNIGGFSHAVFNVIRAFLPDNNQRFVSEVEWPQKDIVDAEPEAKSLAMPYSCLSSNSDNPSEQS
jgi:hypothetical protein